MVDGAPPVALPPSITSKSGESSSTSSPGSTAAGLPLRFALVAGSGVPQAHASARATACAGTRTATVPRAASIAGTSPGGASQISDNGPGQKSSASRDESSDNPHQAST